MEQKATVGRIVHYKLSSGTSKGEVRPAIITRVWSDDCVQLKIFLDEANDRDVDAYASSCVRADSDLGKGYPDGLGCWSWPPRA